VSDPAEALILDLLEWASARERTYEEAMDAWRTSCPRFPIWEDATDRGWIATEWDGARSLVHLTPTGAAVLADRRGKAAHAAG